MTEDLKLKRMEYLTGILNKYLNTEPKLSLEDLCLVLCEEVEDISDLLKAYKKQIKKV